LAGLTDRHRDTSKPQGELLLTIVAGFAMFERERDPELVDLAR
jgi:hypothetical protein